MKKSFIFLAGLAVIFTACHYNPTDSLIGDWTVDKVNVQFDERQSSPELVKQMGEMEKQNVFSINSDSTLVFKGLDMEWQCRISLKDDGTLLCDGMNFGTWKEGQIITQIPSPIGEIVVTYRKK